MAETHHSGAAVIRYIKHFVSVQSSSVTMASGCLGDLFFFSLFMFQVSIDEDVLQIKMSALKL